MNLKLVAIGIAIATMKCLKSPWILEFLIWLYIATIPVWIHIAVYAYSYNHSLTLHCCRNVGAIKTKWWYHYKVQQDLASGKQQDLASGKQQDLAAGKQQDLAAGS